MTELIVSAAVALGMAAGGVFGHLISEAINEMDKRARARAAWINAWRVSR